MSSTEISSTEISSTSSTIPIATDPSSTIPIATDPSTTEISSTFSTVPIATDSSTTDDSLALGKSAAAEALNGVLDDAGDDAVVSSDVDVETLQISLSPTALANLWGLAALCIVGNLVAYFCFCRGTKKRVRFEQNGRHDQYISDQ